jgi:hypothetical protein
MNCSAFIVYPSSFGLIRTRRLMVSRTSSGKNAHGTPAMPRER